jgi:hydroxymethylbilane synthase
VTIRTSGDEGEREPAATEKPPDAPRDKSRFVKEIEEALLRQEIELAVHSAKDVPGALPEGLAIVAVPMSEDPRDALVGGNSDSLQGLPEGARVGTSSLRRRSQLLALRPDLEIAELRGNVDTRLRKLSAGDYDVIVVAMAGLARLGRAGEASAVLGPGEMVPAPGQGILALEARAGDDRVAVAAASVGDSSTVARLQAERSVMRAIGASCQTPVGAFAEIEDDTLHLQAYVGLPDGSAWIRDEVWGEATAAVSLGQELSERMLAAGAEEILRRAETLATS